VWIAAGKVPYVAGIELVDFRPAARIYYGCPHPSFQDESPFCGGRMPVKFPRRSGLQAHRDAGDARGDGQFLYGRFLAEAPCYDFPWDCSSANLNVGSSFPENSGSGTLFLKGKFAASPVCHVIESPLR